MSQSPPTTLGKYQIIREIARSNDIVYEAYDPVMNRRVAVKELSIPSGSSQAQKDDRLKRFMREARAAGSLTHPNIVTIFEVGEDNGRTFIAMEFLDGKNLRSEIDKLGFLPRERAIEIAESVLSGLSFAHSRGVIHRDIKPDNVQLLENGSVKITDFGIARLTFEPNLTMDGQVFGTPSYMSPEQINGKELDARSDVFSVGVILYEMLAGQKPFVGDSVVAITYSIMNREPDMPANMAYPLWEVIERALNKLPQFRYSSAEEMKKALSRAAASWSGPPQAQTPPAVFGVQASAPPVLNPYGGPANQPHGPYQPGYGQHPAPGQVLNQPYGQQYGQPHGQQSYGQQHGAYTPYSPGGPAQPGQVLNQPYNPGGQQPGQAYSPYSPYGAQPPQTGLGGISPPVPVYYPPPPRRPLVSDETRRFLIRLAITTVLAVTLVGLLVAAVQALVGMAERQNQESVRSTSHRPPPSSTATASNASPAPTQTNVQPETSPTGVGEEDTPKATPEELFNGGMDLARSAAREPIDDRRSRLWRDSQKSFMDAMDGAGTQRGQVQTQAVGFYLGLSNELWNAGEQRRARQAVQQAEGLAVGNDNLTNQIREYQRAFGV